MLGSLSSVANSFLAQRTENCTSLLDGNIIVVLLWLFKRYSSGQVCSVLIKNSFLSAKNSGDIYKRNEFQEKHPVTIYNKDLTVQTISQRKRNRDQ